MKGNLFLESDNVVFFSSVFNRLDVRASFPCRGGNAMKSLSGLSSKKSCVVKKRVV